MTVRRSSIDLGRDAEALLGTFPLAERDWETDVRNVTLQLAAIERASTASALLEAPLPIEPGEPTLAAALATPLVDSGVRSQSLAEIARRSLEQTRAAERDMARASLALAARQKPNRQSAALPSETALERRVVTEHLAPTVPPKAGRATPATALRPAPVAVAPAPPNEPGRGKRVALVLSGLALAAGVWFWFAGFKQPAAPPGAGAPTVALAAPPAPATVSNAQSAAQASAAVAAAPPVVVDPNTLTWEPSKAAKEAAPEQPSPALTRPNPASKKEQLAESGAQPSAPGAPAPPEVERRLPADPGLRPADSTSGAIPLKPSMGAVQAALGAVMSGARHCVAGAEAQSGAAVVFASDGHVQSVTVDGPAAGKPAGACIESQLSRARVQPFAAANFSIHASVRPD